MMLISRVAHYHCLLLLLIVLSGSLFTVWGVPTDEWPSKDNDSVKTELAMKKLSYSGQEWCQIAFGTAYLHCLTAQRYLFGHQLPLWDYHRPEALVHHRIAQHGP